MVSDSPDAVLVVGVLLRSGVERVPRMVAMDMNKQEFNWGTAGYRMHCSSTAFVSWQGEALQLGTMLLTSLS